MFSFGGHGDLPRVLRYLCTGLEPAEPGDPPAHAAHLRPPHDYGVAVILVGIADRMVPPEQVEPLRRGIVTFLTRVAARSDRQGRGPPPCSRKRGALAAQLPEPAASLMQQVNARDVKGLGRAAAAGARDDHLPRLALAGSVGAAAGRRCSCCTARTTR